MKTARLRVDVTVEDAALLCSVQERLRGVLDALGTENLPAEDGEDLGGPVRGPRVFWQTSEVKQGMDRERESPAAKRKAAK